MKLSELKETIREISRNKFYESLNEASISIGSKEFVNKNDSEDTILDIATQYAKFPHTKLKTDQKSVVNAFKDVSKLLGIPTSHPMDVLQYKNGKPQRTSVPKPIGSKSLLFPLLKSGKVDKQEYMSLWKDLNRTYNGLVTSYISVLFKIGTHVNVKDSGAGARSAAMKDMQGQFDI